MNISRRFYGNFAHPVGFLGRVVAWRLDISNQIANDWTVSLLGIKPTDHVLEIGIGSGKTLRKVAALVPYGHIVGIDSSETMVELVRGKRPPLTSGSIFVKWGMMESIPCRANSFDKAYAVQVVNCLPNLQKGLKELLRVLKPGGHTALFFEPREKFIKTQKLIHHPYDAEEIVEALRKAGFKNVGYETTIISPQFHLKGICVLGEK